MLKVSKSSQGGKTLVELTGSIDENTSLEKELGKLSGDVVIVSREVTRINSAGVKSWINYFSKLISSGGAQVTLRECSPAVVESLNMISNFTGGAAIESILVPYMCTNCDTEQLVIKSLTELRKSSLDLSPIKCVKCGSSAEFDDLPEAYFQFLK